MSTVDECTLTRDACQVADGNHFVEMCGDRPDPDLRVSCGPGLDFAEEVVQHAHVALRLLGMSHV
jgi:hypothetical protein